jgi:hypothetical protein
VSPRTSQSCGFVFDAEEWTLDLGVNGAHWHGGKKKEEGKKLEREEEERTTRRGEWTLTLPLDWDLPSSQYSAMSSSTLKNSTRKPSNCDIKRPKNGGRPASPFPLLTRESKTSVCEKTLADLMDAAGEENA